MAVCPILQTGVGGEYGPIQPLPRVGGTLKSNKASSDTATNHSIHRMNRFSTEDTINVHVSADLLYAM